MTKPNSVNIVLLERCWHPLSGDFAPDRDLDDPLEGAQVAMLRLAVDRMLRHFSEDARDLVAAMTPGRDLVPGRMNVGQARQVAGLIEVLWERTPQEERSALSEWFRDFNSAPMSRILPEPMDRYAKKEMAPEV